ncbi:hypothetical protein Nther_0326 [Natranaerobius thermophilus JW/NM-WN-LF]|uniref:ATP-grasp domain-containing protein n=2 Tax=Natranaerobius TaxID=375928 RepID=B2A589_NATTJ|nr:hypothetical protein Nther_0326 [Natranaerobius thermophilus JW/NM-WN-LF]
MSMIPVTIMTSNENVISISDKENIILKSLGEKKTDVQLIAGNRTCWIKLKLVSKKGFDNIFYMTESVKEELMLSDSYQLNLKLTEQGLELGPFLGVLISESKHEKLVIGDFDSIYSNFQNWMAQKNGLIYFFTLKDIDINNLIVTGHYWDKDSNWSQKKFPFPKVVYDRCFGLEGRADSYKLRSLVNTHGLNTFIYNWPVKIGKLETYESLKTFPYLKGVIPPFIDYSRENLQKFINDHKAIILKPDKMYKGKGIASLEKKDEKYILKYSLEDETNESDNDQIKHEFEDLDSAIQKINEILDISRGYVIQKKITLGTFLGNNFDIRVMLQRRHRYKWEVTGINARISPTDSIITSPRSGGKVIAIDKLLKRVFPGKEEYVKNRIISVSKRIGTSLEEKYGFIGELGVDLALEANGAISLIEVNSKPLKVSFNRLKNKGLKKRINQIPILLGCELSGFDPAKIHPKQKLTSEYNKNDVFQFKKSPNKIIGNELEYPPIYLNNYQIKLFKLNEYDKVEVQIGQKSEEMIVKQQNFDSDPNFVYLDSKAYEDFAIPSNTLVKFIAKKGSKLQFGITMGITISSTTFKFLKSNEQGTELDETVHLASQYGVMFYCIDLESIDWNKQTIKGLYYDINSQKWRESQLQFPQILYDQATYPGEPVRRQTIKEQNQSLRQNLSELEAINNKRFFGKWETWDSVNFFEELKQHLPETRILTSNNLHEMLAKYQMIYCKSNYGSHGTEVVRIYNYNHGYCCEIGGKTVETWTFLDKKVLIKFVIELVGENGIVQQPVYLANLNGRPFDMRILAQKDHSNSWSLTVISIRIGQKNAVITNVAGGADELIVVPGDKLAYPIPGWEILHEFTTKICDAIEASFGMQGEIGLDVAVDVNQQLWLIEANSKPDIAGLNNVMPQIDYRRILSMPILYATYLLDQMEYG